MCCCSIRRWSLCWFGLGKKFQLATTWYFYYRLQKTLEMESIENSSALSVIGFGTQEILAFWNYCHLASWGLGTISCCCCHHRLASCGLSMIWLSSDHLAFCRLSLISSWQKTKLLLIILTILVVVDSYLSVRFIYFRQMHLTWVLGAVERFLVIFGTFGGKVMFGTCDVWYTGWYTTPISTLSSVLANLWHTRIIFGYFRYVWGRCYVWYTSEVRYSNASNIVFTH